MDVIRSIGKTEVDKFVDNNLTPNVKQNLKISIDRDDLSFESNRDLKNLSISGTELLEQRKRIDSADGIENELLVSKDAKTIVNIDINGNLLISDKYAKSFKLNELGELIFNR